MDSLKFTIKITSLFFAIGLDMAILVSHNRDFFIGITVAQTLG